MLKRSVGFSISFRTLHDIANAIVEYTGWFLERYAMYILLWSIFGPFQVGICFIREP